MNLKTSDGVKDSWEITKERLEVIETKTSNLKMQYSIHYFHKIFNFFDLIIDNDGFIKDRNKFKREMMYEIETQFHQFLT
jgi:hypothetical protein